MDSLRFTDEKVSPRLIELNQNIIRRCNHREQLSTLQIKQYFEAFSECIVHLLQSNIILNLFQRQVQQKISKITQLQLYAKNQNAQIISALSRLGLQIAQINIESKQNFKNHHIQLVGTKQFLNERLEISRKSLQQIESKVDYMINSSDYFQNLIRKVKQAQQAYRKAKERQIKEEEYLVEKAKLRKDYNQNIQSWNDIENSRKLYLFSCNIDQLPQKLGTLNKLQILGIHNNKGLKSLPLSFSDLQSLNGLSLDIQLLPEQNIFQTKPFSQLTNLNTLNVWFQTADEQRLEKLKAECRQRKIKTLGFNNVEQKL